MDILNIILGPVTTEKSERLKLGRSYTLLVRDSATKVDVKKALKKFYDVDVASVRVMRTVSKQRQLNAGRVMTKRHSEKKVIVTLQKDSKALDFSKFTS